MQRNYIQNRTFCKFLNYLTQQCFSSPTPMAKVSLEATGKIADGHPRIGAGYDSIFIDHQV